MRNVIHVKMYKDVAEVKDRNEARNLTSLERKSHRVRYHQIERKLMITEAEEKTSVSM